MYTDQSIETVIRDLATDLEDGLTLEEAQKRLKEQGPNRLEGQKKKGAVALFWEQLNNPLIYILMIAILQPSPIGILASEIPSLFSKSDTALFTPGSAG